MPQLRALPALGRTRSVWAAADELAVAHVSVSAALHAPSPEIGAELTERVGRGIRPSAAGEAFAPYAAHVVGRLEEGRRAVDEAVEAGERELLAVIASPEDALTEWETVDAAALGERTWLPRREGSGTRACNEAFLARHEISPRTLTLGSNGAINEAAPSRLGFSLVSRVTAALELDAGLLGTLAVAGLPERRWYAHRSTVGPRRSAVADFFGFIGGPVAHDALLTARAARPASAAGPVGASV